jgi:hypothetical protein
LTGSSENLPLPFVISLASNHRWKYFTSYEVQSEVDKQNLWFILCTSAQNQSEVQQLLMSAAPVVFFTEKLSWTGL